MNQGCIETDFPFACMSNNRDFGMSDLLLPPLQFGGNVCGEDSSDESTQNFPLTSFHSSLLLMEPAPLCWDNLPQAPSSTPAHHHHHHAGAQEQQTSEQFPSPTAPYTGVGNQPLNHFVSIAFSPHQLTHLPQSPTPIEALQLTPSSLYPYTVLPGHTMGQDHRGAHDHARKYVRRLLTTTNSTAAAAAAAAAAVKPPRASVPPTKKIARSLTGTSTKVPSSPTACVGHTQDQDSSSVKRRFCHVCRSAKEVTKVVVCSSGKQSHVFCSSCVRRRLGLDFDQLLLQPDWICPKCNDQCPCSKCRKK